MIKRVLVAVDGSKASARSADAAVAIAKAVGASLFVLSVIPTPVLTESSPTSRKSAGAAKQYVNVAKEKLEAFIDDIEERAEMEGVKVRGEIEENVSSVVKAILDYADEWEVDLIVVGTRGLGGFRKLVLGSVSSGVVAHAPCDVLVVR